MTESEAIISKVVRESLNILSDDRRFAKASAANEHTAYWTDAQLAAARNTSRQLFRTNEFAIGGTKCRRNYIVGNGFVYEFVSKNPGLPIEAAALSGANAWLEEWIEVNDINEVEAETWWRNDRDGESLIRLFGDDDSDAYCYIPAVRFVEPERCRSNFGVSEQSIPNPNVPNVVHGVQSAIYDNAIVEGFWVENYKGDEPKFVPEAEVVHFKCNVDSAHRRGIPVYDPVTANLLRCEDLLTSMSTMAKARAKIALLMRLKNLTQTNAEDILARLTKGVQTQADGTYRHTTIEELPLGSIIRVKDGDTVEMPASSIGASDFVDVLQADLRAVASLLNMAEWMFTGLADQKYSNAFVVEAPTLKEFQGLQRFMVQRFGEGRKGTKSSLAWRAARMAEGKDSRLPQGLLDLLKIKCTPPNLEVRDKQAEASVNVQYITAEVKSVELVQSELGIDGEVVAKQIADRKKAVADAAAKASAQTNGGGGNSANTFPVKESLLGSNGVPDVRQEFDYDCGAALTASVCRFFGVDLGTLQAYREELKTTTDGTNTVEILRVLKQQGLDAEVLTHMDLASLRKWVDAGRIVMTPIQDYGGLQDETKLLAGHWVGVIGADDANVTLQDPWAGRVFVSPQVFLEHWRDDDDGPGGDPPLIDLGIVVGRGEVAESFAVIDGEHYTREAAAWALEAKDLSKLQKKVIVNKKGDKQTVYVKGAEAAKVPEPKKFDIDTHEISPGHVSAEGTFATMPIATWNQPGSGEEVVVNIEQREYDPNHGGISGEPKQTVYRYVAHASEGGSIVDHGQWTFGKYIAEAEGLSTAKRYGGRAYGSAPSKFGPYTGGHPGAKTHLVVDSGGKLAASESFKKEHPHHGQSSRIDPTPNPLLPDDARPPMPDKATAEAIANYCWGYDKEMNASLRDTGKPPKGDYGSREDGKAAVDGPAMYAELEKVFAKIKPWKPPVVVNRAIESVSADSFDSLEKAARKAMDTGGVATMPGFVSTSTGTTFSGKVMLTIHAVQGLDVKPYSHFTEENELLLNHNCKYRVRSVKVTSSPIRQLHIELEQMPSANREKPVSVLDGK